MQKVKAIQAKNKQRLLESNKNLNDNSGIYFLTRIDENGIKYAYIGQAVDILQRMISHLSGYQHIDLSLKKHGLYSDKNICGWKIRFLEFEISQLDEKEQFYIKQYALNGYQLRNKTSGSQGEGKQQIAEFRPQKGYHDGLKQGYKNASREISNLFEKHLDFTTKNDAPNKNQEKALQKFQEFLDFYKADRNIKE
jgi:hypothetical protein